MYYVTNKLFESSQLFVDGAVSKRRRKNQDGWKDLFIHVLFEIIVILMMVILLAEGNNFEITIGTSLTQ